MALESFDDQHAHSLDLLADALEATQIDLPYEYSPLQENHIRIISIQPGRIGSSLELRLNQVSLEYTGVYTTLSYAWEGQAADVGVKVDGRLFNVSHNVYEALSTLRMETVDVKIWVDAICINQLDLGERSSQVQMMGEIFEGSEIVTVWLGDEDERTALKVEIIEKLSGLWTKYQEEPLPVTFNFKTVLDKDQIFNLGELFDRPWFSRLWVFQEYVLGKNVVLRIGSHTINPDKLYCASRWAGKHQVDWEIGGGHFDFIALQRSRGIYGNPELDRSGDHFDLKRLLLRTRHRQATDARDKVFALLPVATETYGIVADYSKTKAEIFTNLATCFLQQSDNFRILGHAHGSSDCSSWVPDWSYNAGSFSYLVPWLKRGKSFKASRSTRRRLFISDNSHNEIKLQGKLQDEISQTFPYGHLLRTRAGKTNKHKLGRLLSKVGKFFSGDEVYGFTGEALEVVYLKTLMADHSLDSARVSNNYCRKYYPAGLRRQELGASSEELDFQVEKEILETVYTYAHGRTMFQTRKGYIGILPEAARSGDLMCLFLGGEVLYILRPEEEAGNYKFIGECYAHGLMDGEGLDGIDVDTEVFDTFTIV